MNFGYAGNILSIDLSTGHMNKIPTETYATRFLGGRGIGSKMYWDALTTEAGELTPEDPLIFVTGPVCGVPGFAGSRWQVLGKSPVNNRFSYSNLGGSWGVQLKFAGFDGLIIKGKADRPVYLTIDEGNAKIKDATHLKGRGAIETRKKLKHELGKNARILAIGPAGENLVSFATLLADEDAASSWGYGTSMGIKNLKAIAVRGQGKINVADPGKIKDLRKLLHHMKRSKFLFDGLLASTDKLKKSVCFGCIRGCWRSNYTFRDGNISKHMCQPSTFYVSLAEKYYGKTTDIPYKANHLCNEYGLDTRVVESVIQWLIRCRDSGALTSAESELLLSKIGSLEFIENLVRKISYREGIGHILAKGPLEAARKLIKDTDELIGDLFMESGDKGDYDPRLYVTTGLLYALEPRTPIQMLHEISVPVMLWVLSQRGVPDINMTSDLVRGIGKQYWGSEAAADFSTHEGKALAAVKIQDRQYALESLVLCAFSWPLWLWGNYELIYNDTAAKDLEAHICTAVTGKDMDETELYTISHRIINLQRAILLKEGRKGRKDDSIEEYNYTVPFNGEILNENGIVPGPNGKICSKKGMVLNRNEFEKLKDEYYLIRGWDVATGLQKRTNLEELDLTDVAVELDAYGLLSPAGA